LIFMGLVVQFCKCSIWAHFGLPSQLVFVALSTTLGS
jgi:hypothetical protein